MRLYSLYIYTYFSLYLFNLFLVADTQLYKTLCPSIGPSVRRSVRHARVVTLELKTRKTRVFYATVSIVCV